MPEQYEGITKRPFLLLARLSKRQKRILGWLYVCEMRSPEYMEIFGTELEFLRLICWPMHRRRIKITGRTVFKYPRKTFSHHWYLTRSESASFCRSVRRLELWALIRTQKFLTHATWEERHKVVDRDHLNRALRKSRQKEKVWLTKVGRKIAERCLIDKMKERMAVNMSCTHKQFYEFIWKRAIQMGKSHDGGKNAEARVDQERRG